MNFKIFNMIKHKKQINSYLDEPTYAKALDCFTKGCCDIIFEHPCNDSILLVERNINPAKGVFWIIGGRMRHGLDVYENIDIITQREINIKLKIDKLKLLCVTNYLWGEREQYPIDNGTSDIVLVFKYKLHIEEFENIILDKTEYKDNVEWVEPEYILKDPTKYHEAIIYFSNILQNEKKTKKDLENE